MNSPGWGKSLPAGEGLGVAFHFSHRGYVAMGAHVAVTKSGSLAVKRIVGAVDIGETIMNLSGAVNQVEGSGVDAISTAPAIANAVFAATGKRMRSMPFNQHDLSWV